MLFRKEEKKKIQKHPFMRERGRTVLYFPTYLQQRELKHGKEREVRMEEREGIDDLQGITSFSSIARANSSFETADQDPINGGGLVFDGVEDRFHVRLLSDLDLEGRHRPQPKKEKKRETDTDAEEKDKQTEGSLSLSLY